MFPRLPIIVLALALCCSPTARAADVELPYPNAQIQRTGDRVVIYGAPMGSATSAVEAAEHWLASHGDLICPDGKLVEIRESVLRQGKFTVFAYRQYVDGIRVVDSRARILVREPAHGESKHSVVFVSSSGMVEGELGEMNVSAAMALEAISNHTEFDGTDWRAEPELVIQNASGRAIRCWSIATASTDRSRARAFFFLVDCENGRVVDVVDAIHHADVVGTVNGMQTPGLLPDSSANEPEETVLPELRVEEEAGDSAYTDGDGTYVISGLPSGPVTLEATLTGTWAYVVMEQGTDETVTESGTAPGTVDLLFNSDETAFETAAVNAYVHATKTHDFYQSRIDDLAALDVSIACHVNLDDSCNAYFTTANGPSINFFSSGSDGGFDCPNTSYSSVVAHEYGHFIVYALDLAQGAFGEGFADCVSMLQFDDPLVGADFFGPGDPVRDNETTVETYPCTGGVHKCGQVLAGSFWQLKKNLQDSLGDDDGLEEARQIFVDWSAMTIGGDGSDSAHADTVIEVLTVDDDDGELSNGTPNYGDICDAFDSHGLECPAVDPITFSFPDGRPEKLSFSGATAFTVVVQGAGGTPAEGSAELWFRPNGCYWESMDLESLGDGEYEVKIPVELCTDSIDYYIEAEDALGLEYTVPADAPTGFYTALVADDEIVLFDDDFEEDEGWSLGCTGDPDTATTGIWVYGDPIGTSNATGQAQPEFDFSDDGTFCAFTGQGTFGGAIGEEDVDGGKTTMVSPRLDLSEDGEYQIRYARWYSNHTGLNPAADTLQIAISAQDGDLGTWVEVEVVGPAGEGTTGGWFEHAFNVSDFITPTEEVRVRFRAEDSPNPLDGTGSLVEAAVDEFRVIRYTCIESLDFERGDCNGDGSIDVSDSVALLSHLFQDGDQPLCLDACDGGDSGDLSAQDALLLLVSLFQGVALPSPYLECGGDETEDELNCLQSGCD